MNEHNDPAPPPPSPDLPQMAPPQAPGAIPPRGGRPPARTGVLAIIGLICGILGILLACACAPVGFLVCIAGIIMSALDLRAAKRMPGRSSGVAIAGLVCSIVGLLVSAVFFAVMGASMAQGLAEARATAASGRTVTASDGLCSVALPLGWSAMSDLNDQASIQIGNTFKDCYVIVLSDAKADLVNDSIGWLSETTRADFTAMMTEVTEEGPTTLTVNGREAILYEITGISDDIRLHALHVVVEGDEHLHQIVAYTPKSKIGVNRAVLEEVVHSLEETGPATP